MLFTSAVSKLPAPLSEFLARLYSIHYFLVPIGLSVLTLLCVLPHRKICLEILQIAPARSERRAYYRTQRLRKGTAPAATENLEHRSCIFWLYELRRKVCLAASTIFWISGWAALTWAYGVTCNFGMPPLFAALCVLYVLIAHALAGAHAGLSLLEAETYTRGDWIGID